MNNLNKLQWLLTFLQPDLLYMFYIFYGYCETITTTILCFLFICCFVLLVFFGGTRGRVLETRASRLNIHQLIFVHITLFRVISCSLCVPFRPWRLHFAICKFTRSCLVRNDICFTYLQLLIFALLFYSRKSRT